MGKEFFEKYLEAMPYSMIWPAFDNQNCFYLRDLDGTRKLHHIDLNKSCNLEEGKKILDEDFSKRHYSPVKYIPETKELYFLSDTDNKEDYNVYKIKVGETEIKKITNSTYCGIYGIRNNKLVYSDRFKIENGKFYNELLTLDLKTNEKKSLIKESDEEYRFSWGWPCFSTDNKYVILNVDKDNKRQKCNLVKIDIETGEYNKLLTKNEETVTIDTLNYSFGPDGFLYSSDVDGFDNVYHYNFETKSSKQLTHFKQRNNGISLVLDGEKAKALVCSIPIPEKDETEIHYFPLNDKENDFTEKSISIFKGPHYLGSMRQSLWLAHTAFNEPSIRQEYIFENGKLEKKRKINLYHGDKNAIVHADYKFIKYKSFDGLEIPAYLIIPRGELKGAMIKAFYGGDNYYDYAVQMFAEKGIATLSPAVRGSWGFGKEWEAMIKGDLGGNEMLDVIWGAKYLSCKLNLDSSKIGVEGGSHGGYAVLRLTTMPQNFNNQDSKYPFGFGICWAGFADLVDFYHTSNIPDWLVDLVGPFDEAKYKDRSPLTHFDELETPLFIIHGTHDSRVSPSSMKGFIDKLEKSDKEYDLHIIDGQGHTTGSKEEKIVEYKKLFSFLNKYLFN